MDLDQDQQKHLSVDSGELTGSPSSPLPLTFRSPSAPLLSPSASLPLPFLFPFAPLPLPLHSPSAPLTLPFCYPSPPTPNNKKLNTVPCLCNLGIWSLTWRLHSTPLQIGTNVTPVSMLMVIMAHFKDIRHTAIKRWYLTFYCRVKTFVYSLKVS